MVPSNILDEDEDAQLQSFDNVYNTTKLDNTLTTGKPFLSTTLAISSPPQQIDRSRLKSDISQQKSNIQHRDVSTISVHHIDAVAMEIATPDTVDTYQEELSNRSVRGAKKESDPTEVRYGYHHITLRIILCFPGEKTNIFDDLIII